MTAVSIPFLSLCKKRPLPLSFRCTFRLFSPPFWMRRRLVPLFSPPPFCFCFLSPLHRFLQDFNSIEVCPKIVFRIELDRVPLSTSQLGLQVRGRWVTPFCLSLCMFVPSSVCLAIWSFVNFSICSSYISIFTKRIDSIIKQTGSFFCDYIYVLISFFFLHPSSFTWNPTLPSPLLLYFSTTHAVALRGGGN